MPPQRVRAVVVGALRRDNEILAMELVDRLENQVVGYRPPGGEIDFGESSDVALARELAEELNQEVVIGKTLAILENHYTLNGGRGHELVVVRAANFCDQKAYEIDEFTIKEPADDGGEFIDRAVWVSPLRLGAPPIMPSGISEILI